MTFPVFGTDGALVLSYLATVFGDLALFFVLAFLFEHVGGRSCPSQACSSTDSVGAKLAGLFEFLETQALLARETSNEVAKTLATWLFFFLFGDGGAVWQDAGDAPDGTAGWTWNVGAGIVEDAEDQCVM